ncbi:MAG: CRISPR system precrRNA processing endoribonuclease RAMP protein Cas6 [Oscillospiraceae bacterium]|nr:CRISPR system precrRNA processing endoribonuclease RAMP protein Cas6 [Oscillospiraceae bacterium]
MITQFRLKLECGQSMSASNAYRLYAALLDMAPDEFGEQMHNGEITPIRQHLVPTDRGGLWTVNLMGEQVEDVFGPILQNCDTVQLKALKTNCSVAEKHAVSIRDADDLFARTAGHGAVWKLDFVTPAVFKSRGSYVMLPTQRLMIQNLIKSWNGCFPDCLIEDEDGEGMEALALGLTIKAFSLHDRYYSLKGRDIPGFIGSITLENRLSGFHRELAAALLCFAQYSGIGAKTSLGMGGVRVE